MNATTTDRMAHLTKLAAESLAKHPDRMWANVYTLGTVYCFERTAAGPVFRYRFTEDGGTSREFPSWDAGR